MNGTDAEFMEETVPKKNPWIKIGLMLVVLIPFISTAFYFFYFWFHGVTFTK
jgi:hypothetical protein